MIPDPYPRQAISPDHFLLVEDELLLAEQTLLPGNCTILRKGRARPSAIVEVVCSMPNPRLAVPLEILPPEEVKHLRAGQTLLLDESV